MKEQGRLSVANIKDIYTMSSLQEGMFFNWLLEPESITYFEQQSVREYDALNIEVLKQSLQLLVNRHDILRTVFIQKTTDRPIQVVLKESPVDFTFMDISTCPDKEEQVLQFKEDDKKRYFNLSKDILLRVTVFELGVQEYELIWSWHHILMDAWCINTLKQEFYHIYNSMLEGAAIDLPAPEPYGNYIRWIEVQDRALSEAYWQNLLENYSQIATVPFNEPSQDVNYAVEQLEIELNEHITDTVIGMLAEKRITQSSFFQTLWGITLAKCNDVEDAVFGVVVSGRPPAVSGIENMIGAFINTIPVRVKFGNGTRFIELLRGIQKQALEGVPHHYYALAEIQAKAAGGMKLFDHIFLFQNFSAGGPDRPIDVLPEKEQRSGRTEVFESYFYDFNIFIIPGQKIKVLLKFNSNKYKVANLRALLDYFNNIIKTVVADMNVQIDDLSLLSTAAQENLISHLHPLPRHTPPANGFVELFEKQAALVPDNIAITCDGISLTYNTLNNQSDRLAACLQGRGVKKGDRVGVLTYRSEKLVIGLLAILKLNASFVPLDPLMPAERRRYILDDAGISFLLTESSFLQGFDGSYNGGMIALDIQLDGLEEAPYNKSSFDPGNMAYVLYTSGSTGKPKGVMIRHSSFLNYLLWANAYYFSNKAGYSFAFFTSLSFDLTITSIFTTLLRGDTLRIYADKDVTALLKEVFADGSGVNTVKLTPSHISLLDELEIKKTGIRTVIVGGEAFTNKQADVLKRLHPAIRIYNEYGPTEATVGCSVKEITDPLATITIGNPISNMAIYILNKSKKVQPSGIFGELGISGLGLAAGYLNNEVLTNDKFIKNPYRKGEVLYLTGDIGKWLPAGEILYAGRKDDQVKIRGYRIEPGEIEAACLKLPGVQECVCVPDRNSSTLMLYYRTTDTSLDEQQLERHLKGYVPEYMIPAVYIPLASFALTTNGKIDRRKLPDPRQSGLQKITLPGNELEAGLLRIWKDVLELEAIGVEDRFFSLGGHSLKATQVASRILKEMQIKVSLKDIFEYQTIRELAGCISQHSLTQEEEIPVAPAAAYYQISRAQQRIWVTSRLQQDARLYTPPSTVVFDQCFNLEAFECAIEKLVERHEILRTTFGMRNDEAVQFVKAYKKGFFKVAVTDVGPNTITALVDEEAYKPFDLEQGPLFRIKILRMKDGHYLVLFSCHHIVSDGWSLEVLMKEFNMLYNAFSNNTTPQMPPLRIQYKDYALWHNNMLAAEKNIMSEYWLNKLGGELPVLQLPVDYMRSVRKTGGAGIYRFYLDSNITQGLQAIAANEGITIFMSLLTGIKIMLYHLTGAQDIIVGTPVAGRVNKDLEGQLGNFLNTLALRDELHGELTFMDLLRNIKTTVVEAYDNQLYPFDMLLEKLQYHRQQNRNPVFDVGFTLQNQVAPGYNREQGNKAFTDDDGKVFRGADTDLWFVAEETGNNISMSIHYDPALFNRETVMSFAEGLQATIQKAMENINSTIKMITPFKAKTTDRKLSINLKM